MRATLGLSFTLALFLLATVLIPHAAAQGNNRQRRPQRNPPKSSCTKVNIRPKWYEITLKLLIDPVYCTDNFIYKVGLSLRKSTFFVEHDWDDTKNLCKVIAHTTKIEDVLEGFECVIEDGPLEARHCVSPSAGRSPCSLTPRSNGLADEDKS